MPLSFLQCPWPGDHLRALQEIMLTQSSTVLAFPAGSLFPPKSFFPICSTGWNQVTQSQPKCGCLSHLLLLKSYRSFLKKHAHKLLEGKRQRKYPDGSFLSPEQPQPFLCVKHSEGHLVPASTCRGKNCICQPCGRIGAKGLNGWSAVQTLRREFFFFLPAGDIHQSQQTQGKG